MRRILDAGADVNSNVIGATPLQLSFTTAVTRMLLAAGADVHRLDREGLPVIHRCAWRACHAHSEGLFGVLQQAGADVNAVATGRYGRGRTPLHCMADRRMPLACPALLRELLQAPGRPAVHPRCRCQTPHSRCRC